MEKLIYLLWAPEDPEPAEIREQFVERCGSELLDLAPRGLSINVNDCGVPAALPTPADERPLSAEVCVWLDCLDRRAPLEEVLRRVGWTLAGYLVTESLYTEYGENHHAKPRDWPDGERSPGLLTVTLLEKPPRFESEAWFRRWYGTQSPVSDEIQPRMRYVRNAVVRAVTPDAPAIDGIVDEAWPSVEHITDPMLFYCADGSAEQMQTNIGRMIESVNGFLDMDRIRTVTMSEYLLKT